MNNQITVNNKGVQDIGELVTYFQINQTGKNYVFYTKNELGENNTIKLYACEESNPQIMSDGILSDWELIKKIIPGLARGENNNDIKFLPFKSNINVNSVKHVGLTEPNVVKLKNAYISNTNNLQNNISPADILNQSFGNVNSLEQSNQKPVDLGVNNSPKNFDMEQNSANLSSIPSVEPLPEMPKIEPIISDNSQINIPISPVQPEVVPEAPKIESPYNINSGKNVFDISPQESFGITSEEINKPINETSDVTSPLNNIVTDENKISIDDDLIDAEIAMNDKEINLYKSRIEFLDSKNIFLKSKKSKQQNSSTLTNTASSLFNNNEINDSELKNVPELKKVA